jgi:hypothetical protein
MCFKYSLLLRMQQIRFSAYGLTIEQINQLSDEDMEQIAEKLHHRYDLNDFGEDVLFVVRLLFYPL